MYITGTRVEVTSDPADAYNGMFNIHREVGFIELVNDSVRMTLTEVDGMVFTDEPDPIDSSTINSNYGRFGLVGNDLSGWFYDPENDGWYFTFVRDTLALPITLTYFGGKYLDGLIYLSWTTLSEIDNYGFYIQRRPIRTTEWIDIGFVPGHNTTNVPQQYSYRDSTIKVASEYRLKQVDNTGDVHFSGSWSYEGVLSVDDVAQVGFYLAQNYPNPFSNVTTILFSNDSQSEVSIVIYDDLGREVDTIIDELMGPGIYRYNWDSQHLASGIYFCVLHSKLRSGMRTLVIQMNVIR